MVSKRICNLPEELEHEILLRLPVKTLLVCKCVCKGWCALIKSPCFVNRHFSHESNQERLVFGILSSEKGVMNQTFAMYDDERHSLVDAPIHLRHMRAIDIFLGPEKGIFCVVSIDNSNCIVLWNPAMIEFKTLPPHPLQRQAVIGFGLDPSSGDFKVVPFEKSKYRNSAFVYNLSSDSWKRIETMDLLDKIVTCRLMDIPVLNGVEHWLVRFADHDIYSILAFDIRSEMFQVIAILDALRSTKNILKITAYGDSIAVLSCTNNNCIDLWVMGSDGLWSKNFCVGPFGQKAWPVCVWKKNEVFLQTLSSPLIMCDIFTQKLTTIIPAGVSANFFDPFVYCRLHMYKESLVSLKGERAHRIQDLF